MSLKGSAGHRPDEPLTLSDSDVDVAGEAGQTRELDGDTEHCAALLCAELLDGQSLAQRESDKNAVNCSLSVDAGISLATP